MNQPDALSIVALADAGDVERCGGKAAGLAALVDDGFRVPGGFVVTTAAYRAAHDKGIPKDLATTIVESYRQLKHPTVAVRSSATAEDLRHASMAGQYATVLDVCDEQALLAAVETCWRSLDSPRARAYLKQAGIAPETVAMAVIVQQQVDARIAGVLFTQNPQTGNPQQMLLEASPGLGEAVVSGAVQPDTITLQTTDGNIVDTRFGAEASQTPCLTSREVHALWHLGLSIEAAAGQPRDIEWAIAGKTLYVLQARAITTDVSSGQLTRQIQKELQEAREAGDGPWARSNLAETTPEPTPLTWSLMREFYSGSGGLGTLYRMAGFSPGPAVQTRSTLRLIGGQPFSDLGRTPELFAADFPFEYDLTDLRGRTDAGQAPPTKPRGTFWTRRRATVTLLSAQRTLATLARTYADEFDNQLVPAFRTFVAQSSAVDLSTLPGPKLADHWRDCKTQVMDVFGPQSLLPSLLVNNLIASLTQLLQDHLWDCDAAQLALQLGIGGPADTTIRSNHELRAVALGQTSLASWLKGHGHRGPGEFDLVAPRWHEQPQRAQQLAEVLRSSDDPLHLHQRHCAQAEQVLATTRTQLPPAARPQLDQLVQDLRRYLPYRESAKHEWMRGFDLLRRIAREIGRRCHIGDDVFLLSEADMLAATTTSLVPLARIEDARRIRRWATNLELPMLLDDPAIAGLCEPQPHIPEATESGVLGFGISPGRATGPVTIVDSPTAFSPDMPAGIILVCRSTDPSWTPLFTRAAGIVLERGGVLSHGAVVAREMGIPAVVLPNARTRLQAEGQVRIDGSTGHIAPAGNRDATSKSENNPDDNAAKRDRSTAIAPVLARDSPTASRSTSIPPPGAKERASTKLRNLGLMVWTCFLLGLWVLPASWLHDPTLAIIDMFLWPVVVSVGMPVTVAVVAGAVASATMICQRFVTDHNRLSVVKMRANNILAMSSSHQTRDKALRGLQRVRAAAWVPIAVLLGPLVVSCLWLQARTDPKQKPLQPGESFQVVATVHGEWTSPVELRTQAPLVASSQASQQVPDLRGALQELLRDWDKLSAQLDTQSAIGLATALQRDVLKGDLETFLAGEMPTQELAWSVAIPRTPESEGLATLELQTDQFVIPIRVAVGERTAPQPFVYTGRADAVEQVEVIAPSRHVQPFWQPLMWLGIPWDLGWLGLYLVVYLPSLAISRRALRVP